MHGSVPLVFLIVFSVIGAVTAKAATWVPLGNNSNQDSLVTVLESNDAKTSLRFAVNGFYSQDVDVNGDTCTEISLPGATLLMEKGFPALPRVRANIIIPDEAGIDLKIVKQTEITIPVRSIVPSKGKITRDTYPAAVPYTFSDFYRSNEYYPREKVFLEKPFILRDLRGITVQFNPFRYNPGAKTLTVTTSLIVEVVTTGGIKKGLPQANKDFVAIYKRHFINYGNKKYNPVAEAGNMLIITADAFYNAVLPLAQWKDLKGIPTEIAKISDIGGNTESNIKSKIQTKYDAEGVTYVLLVGDNTQVQPANTGGDESDPLYVLLDGGDSYPDAFISRFCASTVADVENQVARSINYERLPTMGNDWYEKGLGIGSASGPGHNGESDKQHIENIRQDLLGWNYILVNWAYDPGASAASVAADVNDGLSIINYCGHGSCGSWGTTGFDIAEINNLNNGDMLPFIVSVACDVGDFGDKECFGEHWLKVGSASAPKGAIGFYGSSIAQSWSPPMDAQDEIADLLISGADVTFGGLCFNGAMEMIDLNGSDGVDMFETWILFGDCSLPIRTKTPSMLEVTHTLQVPISPPGYPKSFIVSVTDNSATPLPITGALVCVKGPGVQEIGYTDANGQFSKTIVPSSTGLISVVVTQDNFVPYVGYAKACEGYEDIVIRDHPDDDGRMPSWDANHNGIEDNQCGPPDRPPWSSPDIGVDVYPWNPFFAFMPGDFEDPEYGETNRLHVRAWNISETQDAENCYIRLFVTDFGIALPKTLIPPVIGPITIPKLSSYQTYIDWWPQIKGHVCIFAEAKCPSDPIVKPNNAPWDNNIGWRNFNVSDLRKRFEVVGEYGLTREFAIGNPQPEEPTNVVLGVAVESWPEAWQFHLSSDDPWVQLSPTQYVFNNMPAQYISKVRVHVDAPVGTQCGDSGSVLISGSIDGELLGGVTVHVVPPACPVISIEKTHGTLQGHYQEVSITTEGSFFEMGGFDFLIAYDASALTFTEAQPGELLDTCDWEYFTYRFGADGNCGNACPSGLLRLIALAETNNGPYHPSCYGPPDCDPHELARMTFMVSNNRVYNGQYIPIEFFWGDCGDNSLSSVDGQTLYIDRAIYDFEGNVIWDEEDDVQYPEDARLAFVGAPDDCLNPDPDKPAVVRCPEFVNGGIDIVPDTAIDARGDINCNGITNEIADAVMFTNYFIQGHSAFEDHVEASIAASDVNADGIALSVADLVYLIRIITGDALPYQKPLPYAIETSVNALVNHSAVGVSATSPTDIGAGYFVFDYSGLEIGQPHVINGASAMSLKYGIENGTLKVLVYSLEKGVTVPAGTENIFVIPIRGDGSIKLTDVQLSDYQGNLLGVKNEVEPVLPKAFALHQNYPNPFNAGTVIAYELPQASEMKIEIINVLGQKVATILDGRESAGIHTVQWNGTDSHGTPVASGIYVYRMTAGAFLTEKKMVLLK